MKRVKITACKIVDIDEGDTNEDAIREAVQDGFWDDVTSWYWEILDD